VSRLIRDSGRSVLFYKRDCSTRCCLYKREGCQYLFIKVSTVNIVVYESDDSKHSVVYYVTVYCVEIDDAECCLVL